MPTRYTNMGQSGGAIVGTTITDSEKKYSNTGTAVYGNNNPVVPITDLGFTTDVTDLWIRLDFYIYKAWSTLPYVKIFFDGHTVNDNGIYGDRCYYDKDGNSTYGIDYSVYKYGAVNKLVFHATTTSFYFAVNDVVIVDKSNLKNGTKITGISLAPNVAGVSSTISDNNFFSNIIIADYDCSNETLVNNTTSAVTTTHADITRTVKVDNTNGILYHSDGTISSDLKNCTQKDKNYTYNPCSGNNFTNSDGVCLTVDNKKELYLYQQFYGNTWGYILFYSASKNCGIMTKSNGDTYWHTKGEEHDKIATLSNGLHTFKMHVITDADTTKNVMQIWIDGALVYDGNNVSYLNGEPITGVEFNSGNYNSNVIVSESDITAADVSSLFPTSSAVTTTHADIARTVSTVETEHADIARTVAYARIVVTTHNDISRAIANGTVVHADTYTLKKLAPWRYENPGTCNLLSEDVSLDYTTHLNIKDPTLTKTKTGMAYSINWSQNKEMFPVPVDTEAWIKFDAWISPTEIENGNRVVSAGFGGFFKRSGIFIEWPCVTGSCSWYADGNNNEINTLPDLTGLHSYKIHFVAGDAHGQMDIYIDNDTTPLITYTGTLQQKELLHHIGVGTSSYSNDNMTGSCISNLIISNEYVGINEMVKDVVDHGIPAVSHGDIKRYINAEIENHEDTSLTHYYKAICHDDVYRSVSTVETEYADIKRMILDDGKIPVTVRTDICRKTSQLLITNADICRATKKHIRTHNDFVIDKTRTDRFHYTTHNDFTVKKSVIVINHYDVTRNKLLEIKSFMDRYQEVQSININLNELTLSDSIKLSSTLPLFITETVRGKLLDYNFTYSIENTSQKGIQTEAQLMLDCDAILYQPIVYNEEQTREPTYDYDESDMAGLTIREQQLARKAYQEDLLREQWKWKQARKDRSWALSNMQRIASALDKQLVWLADNYMSSNDWLGAGQTFSSVISALWGWTNRVPRRQVNVFIRNDKLYVLQRGHETQLVDITNSAHTVPEIDREIVRTAWTRTAEDDDASNAQGEGDNGGFEHYFSGTKTNKGMSYEYADGLLMQAQGTDEQGNYTWIIYDYRQVGVYGDDAVQMTYKCEQTQGKGESTVAETYYSYASGWCTATKYVDGEYADSSEYQQSEVARVTEFSGAVNLGNAGGSKRKASLMVDRSFPVRTDDVATLEKLTQELQWMNRKTKETVKMDIYHCDHLIDFTDRLKFNGNEHYLVSNDVAQTKTELKQTVTMVRWY